MPAYSLKSTRHHPDGSVETPSADIILVARDDDDADRQARQFPLDGFLGDADYAWLTDPDGVVVCSFPVSPGRAA